MVNKSYLLDSIQQNTAFVDLKIVCLGLNIINMYAVDDTITGPEVLCVL